MKRIVPLFVLVCLVFGIAVIDSCKKDPVIPTLTTSEITNITINAALGGGVVTKDGGAPVTARGVCWGTSGSPVASGSHTSDDKGVGSFVSNITGLTPNTQYYVRAYATNKAGTAYGTEVTFTSTPLVVPTLTTTEVTSITLTSAITGGNITSDGNATVTAKGICWATTTGPTITNDKSSDGTGGGSFITNLTGLQAGTVYFIRAYATNSVGTAYGNEITFTTNSIVLATLTTTPASLLTQTTAVTGGNITADGGGAVTVRGVCYGTAINPTLANSKTTNGTGTGSFISNLSLLVPGTTYHVRAYATNSAGTAYGNDLTFVTSPIVVPTLTTTTATSITLTSAVSGGNIIADGGAPVTVKGVCWATTANPTVSNSKTSDGTGTGTFTSNITGLTAATTYYVRAYATNSAGTAYGNEISFSSGQIVVPTVTTTAITSITLTTAVSGGNVLVSGGGTVTGKGVCWSLAANPTIANSLTSDGTGTGSYVSNLTGLTPGTTYHVRAYAANSAGTAYGNEVIFTTNPILVPTLTTTAASAITLTTAVSGGNISADGGGTVTVRGVCWSTATTPTTANAKTTDGTGTGIFTSNLTILLPGTTYYVRAYATNSAGTAYGNEISFITSPILIPTLTTTAVTSITQTTAISGGNITADGGGAVTSRGVCWAITANPTTANSKTTDGSGNGAFTSNLSLLTPGTTYHVRSYAVNSAGTAYGNDVSFITSPVLVPTVTTSVTSAITPTTATSGGSITSDGGGAITVKGVCWSLLTNPTTAVITKTTDGSGTATFTSSLTGLTPGTVYHIRAYATNSAGTSYGNDVPFTSLPTAVPNLTTTAVTAIGVTTATSGGDISVAGAGSILARGVCYGISTNPTISGSKTSDGIGTGSYTSNITGLTPGTRYYVRAYATNSVGTNYGNEFIIDTKIADVEGNTYNVVPIGTQIWMKENLKTSKYNNGNVIGSTTAVDISGDVTPKYEWAYGDIPANVAIYGRLYTFYAVTDARGVCPTGWHVPSDAEWTTLHDYLTINNYGFTLLTDDIAKSMATTSGWAADPTLGNIGNNQATNNLSGFSALPSGFRHGNDGSFTDLGSKGYWGSATEGATPGSSAWYRALNWNGSLLGRNDFGPWNGYAIRCVK